VLTGKHVVTKVPGMHDQIFRPAGAAVIGKQVRERLAGIAADRVEASPVEQDAPTECLSRAKA